MNQQNKDFYNVLNDHNVLVEEDEGYEIQQAEALQKSLEKAKTLEDLFKIKSFGNYVGSLHVMSSDGTDTEVSSSNYKPIIDFKTLTGFSYEDKLRVVTFCCAVITSVFDALKQKKKLDDESLAQKIPVGKKIAVSLGKDSDLKNNVFGYDIVADKLNEINENKSMLINLNVNSDYLYKMFASGILSLENIGEFIVKFKSDTCEFACQSSKLSEILNILNLLQREASNVTSINSLKDSFGVLLNNIVFTFCGLTVNEIFSDTNEREYELFSSLSEEDRIQLKRTVVEELVDSFSKKIHLDPYKINFNSSFNIDGKVSFITDFNFKSVNVKKASEDTASKNIKTKGKSDNILYYVAQQLSTADFSKFDEKFEIQNSGFVKKFNADWKLVLKPVLDEENIKKTKDALDDLKFEIDERLSKLKFLYDANIPMKKVGQSEIVDDDKISNTLMDVMEDLTEKDEIKSTLSGSGYFFRVTLKKFAVLKKNFNDSKKQIQTLYDVKLKKAKDDYPEVGKDGKISQSKLKSYQNNVSELEDKKESSLSDLKTKYMESRAKLVANAEEAIRAINTLASSISSNQKKLIRAEDFMNSLGKGSYSKDVCDAWKESFLSLLSEEDNVVQKRVPEPKRESDKSYRLNGKLSFNFNNKDYFYTMNLLIVVR